MDSSACLQLRKADTNVTDLIAGYKEIDCMYQLTGNDDDQGEMNRARGETAAARERRGNERRTGKIGKLGSATQHRCHSLETTI